MLDDAVIFSQRELRSNGYSQGTGGAGRGMVVLSCGFQGFLTKTDIHIDFFFVPTRANLLDLGRKDHNTDIKSNSAQFVHLKG